MARPDRETFESLVRQHHAAVYHSALAVLRRADVAEDVAQDVFVRALLGKVPYGDVAEAKGPLCWLAARLALNALRTGRRRHRQEDRAAMDQPTSTVDPDPADRELHAAVRRLVDGLPDELRLPLVLRYRSELTYAAVGRALSVSESTAHERVQSALARLRALLGSAGFAVVPGRLPGLVADPAAAAVPAGLEARLLALTGTAAAGALPALVRLALPGLLLAGAAAAGIAVAVGGGGGAAPPAVAAAPAEERAAGDERSAAARDAAPPASRAALAGGAPERQDPAPAAAHAVLTGTVHDALSWPVSDAQIVAVAAGGLKPFAVARTTTDQGGTFRLEVPLRGRPVPARTIRIHVMEQNQLLLETGELEVARGGEPEPLQLVLPERAGTAASRFELMVAVAGPDGAPLAGVPVALYAPSDPPPRPGQTQPEVEAETGADGVARLTGRTPGRKLVFADGRKLGLRAGLETVAIERPGEHRAAIALAPGLALRGRIGVVGGGVPQWANVWLEAEATGVSHTAKLGEGGSFAFAGLGEGPFTLRVSAHPYSSLALPGLRPGGEPVAVWLKRFDDPRDVGHHLGEVHGRLIDAATGEVVAFGPFSVEIRRLREGASTLAVDRLVPPRPAQRMAEDIESTAFHLTGLEPGTWGVLALVKGYAPAVAVVEVRGTAVHTGLELPLLRGAHVAGRVLGADGAPVARALVFAVGLGDGADANVAAWNAAQGTERAPMEPPPSSLACSARTGEDGAFALRDVPPGAALRIVAVAAGHVPAESAVLVLQPGERRAGLELRAPP